MRRRLYFLVPNVEIDVPFEKVDAIAERVKKHHPEAGPEGTEPTVPPFP